LRIELWQQMLDQLGHPQGAAAGHGVDGSTAAVARHQDAVEMMRNPAQGGPATTLARFPIELACPLLRFEQEHLVGLDDADQALGQFVLDPVEKAMAPAKRGVRVHADALGRRRTVRELSTVSRYMSHFPLCLSRASGVPVRSLKVRPHAQQRKNCKSLAWPWRGNARSRNPGSGAPLSAFRR